jgi:hypothetical protein
MHSYAAYGLCLHSEFPLQDFPGGGRAPDVIIREDELEIGALEAGPRGGARLTGHFYGKLLFEVAGGRSITVHRFREIDDEEVQALVGGSLLAALMRQRGLLTLHASAVSDGSSVVGFLGESGWGKSTLAEAFLQRGYEVLTDDQLVLDFDKDSILAHPGPSSIKLRPEAGAALLADYDALPQIAKRSTQRKREIPRSQTHPLPLARLYVLDSDDSQTNAVEALGGQEAIMHLLTHTWARQMFTDAEYVGRHLEQCAILVRSLPVQRLRRQRSFAALGNHVRLVEEDWLRSVEIAPAA